MRISITHQAFDRWMQSVEDRLKALRRDAIPQSSTVPALSVATLTAGVVTASSVTTGQLGVGNMEAATTLGAVVGRVLIVDQAGMPLGYLPVYDAIT